MTPDEALEKLGKDAKRNERTVTGNVYLSVIDNEIWVYLDYSKDNKLESISIDKAEK